MSEILGSHSDSPRTVNTWGKYRAYLGTTYYHYCSSCWSGIGVQVLRRASSKTACSLCGRTNVRNRLQINEAAD